jgi:transposase-like protein
MSQTPCATNPNHGPATLIVADQRYLCSQCAYDWTRQQYVRRLPVGAVRGGQR